MRHWISATISTIFPYSICCRPPPTFLYTCQFSAAKEGTGGAPLAGGGPVTTHLDHRIAMSMAIAGLASREGVALDTVDPIATSFPGFVGLLADAAA